MIKLKHKYWYDCNGWAGINYKGESSAAIRYGESYNPVDNDVISIIFNLQQKELSFYKNNVKQGCYDDHFGLIYSWLSDKKSEYMYYKLFVKMTSVTKTIINVEIENFEILTILP